MARTVADKRSAFRAMHEKGCFVLPNPWDVGSARMLQHLGFAALASTSAGFAWAMGRPDYAVTRDEVLQHLRSLCLNVVAMRPGLDVAELADLGVRRISIGGSLARVAWAAMLAAAERMKAGSFDGFDGAAAGKQLNDTFRRFV